MISLKIKHKYRERFPITQSIQLKSINYDIRKHLFNIQQEKLKKVQVSSSESSQDEGSDTEIKAEKNSLKNINDLTKWKKIMNIDQQTNVFIIKGGYNDLRRALIQEGWVENKDKKSKCFNLKWTCKLQDIEYGQLEDYQLVNHFEYNVVITSKYGLRRNIRNLIWEENLDVDTFIPRSYDLGDLHEFEDFIENYKFTTSESLLQKFLKVSLNINQIDEKIEQYIYLANEIVRRKYIDFYQQVDSINQYQVITPQEWQKLSQLQVFLTQKLQSSKLLNIQNGNKQNDINNLINRGQHENINLQYQCQDKVNEEETKNYQQNNQQLIKEEEEEEDKNEFNTIQQQNQNPKINELIQLTKETLQKSEQKDPQYNLNGYRNIWIVKPVFLSRGRGIKCFDTLEKIIEYGLGRDTQFIVQKYIENPLIIKKKKFDIRQWVLVQNFNPPKIWFYNECYCRFCAMEYEMNTLNNRLIHLTNNSIAKTVGHKQMEQSEIYQNMWTQETFANYLIEIAGRDIFYEQIQPKLKNLVIYSLKSCSDMIGARTNSFELFGYDFMIDDKYNPWLIEINSSPSMEYSTKITKDLVKKCLSDVVKVVINYSQAKKKDKKQIDTGSFTLIYKGKKDKK